jgi:hypothetical protein
MNRKEFAKRRKTLMRMVGEDGIAILPSAPVKIRNRDVEYRYRRTAPSKFLPQTMHFRSTISMTFCPVFSNLVIASFTRWVHTQNSTCGSPNG